MEIILILIALGIVGYVIVQSLPGTKFDKANSLFSSRKYKEAETILQSILLKHPNAPQKLAECKFAIGVKLATKDQDEAINLFNQILTLKKSLQLKYNQKALKLVEAKAGLEICKINYSRIKAEHQRNLKEAKLRDNLKYISGLVQTGIEDDFALLIGQHHQYLARINYAYGMDCEKSKQFENAVSYYSIAHDYALQSASTGLAYDVKGRTGICRLKSSERLEDISMPDIERASISIKTDFFYRYAITLVSNNRFTEAEKVLQAHLKHKSSQLIILYDIIKVKKQQHVLMLVKQLNTNLDALYEESFPIDKVKALYDSLEPLIIETQSILPEIAEKIVVLRPSLFNRLSEFYLSHRQFTKAIELISDFPNFWKNPELLKNMGISCYLIVADGLLSKDNYKKIVSGWLTAVFSDKVMLKSLENTSWDDAYKFTLVDSIGSNFEIHDDAPDNINHDGASDTNISIGAAQRELVTQFETLLQKNVTNSPWGHEAEAFYYKEKEAIENIVAALPCNILFAAPYFSKEYGLSGVIISELNSDYLEYSDEKSLVAGIPYIVGNTDSNIRQYAAAKELVQQAVNAISNENVKVMRSLANDRRIEFIKKYEGLKTSTQELLYNTISRKIDEDDENELLLEIMEETIKLSPEADKLRYQYSNYVTSYCVSKINDEAIDNLKALSLMKNAYLQSPSNIKVCKNIITLIRFNLLDIMNEGTNKSSAIYSLLNAINSNKSETFKELSHELAKAKKDILGQLTKAGVDIAAIVDNSPFSNTQLTSKGRELKLVLGYFDSLSSSEAPTRRADRISLLNERGLFS